MSNHIVVTILLLSSSFCNTPNPKPVAAEPVNVQDKILVANLTYPWELVWGADGKIWMTERGGKVSRVDPATGKVTPVLTIAEVTSQGEGGLLGLALHPDFATNHQVFVAYDYENNGYKEKVVCYTYNGSTLTQPKVIIDNIHAAGNHNGCRLAFSPDKKLYITTGDAGNQQDPQNKAALNGKVLRVNPDGSIPADNPFANNPVWSFGHRNPQGLVFANGRLYELEHGPNTDDEVNIITKARNYGWRNRYRLLQRKRGKGILCSQPGTGTYKSLDTNTGYFGFRLLWKQCHCRLEKLSFTCHFKRQYTLSTKAERCR